MQGHRAGEDVERSVWMGNPSDGEDMVVGWNRSQA